MPISVDSWKIINSLKITKCQFIWRELMTDNHKKGKNSKPKGKGKKVPNTIRIKNDNNEMHIESEEEYENIENKKLKTEANSDTKIVIPHSIIFTKSALSESLDLLRKCAADNEYL